MSGAPTLSICIPTHDGRAAKLTDALATVVRELEGLEDRVEIVVSDNGSRDATQEVVERYRATLGTALVSHRFEDNVGFSRNLQQIVQVANGRFCWLLGSDDALGEGAIGHVLGLLEEDPELTGLTVDQLSVAADLTPMPLAPRGGRSDPRVIPSLEPALYEDAGRILAELGLLHDFISTQIVHRERWLRAVERIGPEGVASGRDFPHLPILIAMVQGDPRWRWVPEPFVLHRMGEETIGTFATNLGEHALLCINQRAEIWAPRFGTRTALYRGLMRRSWALQATALSIVHYKDAPGHSARVTLRLLRELTSRFWFVREYWLTTLPVVLTPVPVLELARRAVRLVRPAPR